MSGEDIKVEILGSRGNYVAELVRILPIRLSKSPFLLWAAILAQSKKELPKKMNLKINVIVHCDVSL